MPKARPVVRGRKKQSEKCEVERTGVCRLQVPAHLSGERKEGRKERRVQEVSSGDFRRPRKYRGKGERIPRAAWPLGGRRGQKGLGSGGQRKEEREDCVNTLKGLI